MIKTFMKKGVKFAFVGAIGTVVNLGLLYSLTTYLHVYYMYSEFIAIGIAFFSNYIGNILIGNIQMSDSKIKTTLK